MSLILTLFVPIIIALAFFVQAVMGFGGGLMATPILTLFLPVSEAVSLVLIFQFLMGLLIFTLYRDVEWKLILRMMPLTLIGLTLGLSGLQYFNEDYIRIFLSLFILSYLVQKRFKLNIFALLFKHGGAYSAALFGGALAGLIGMGGPAIVIYLKEASRSTKSLRANIIAFFFFTSLIRIPASASLGFITPDILKIAFYTLPFFLIALWSGHKLHDKIPDQIFRRFIDFLLLLSAVFLILKAIL